MVTLEPFLIVSCYYNSQKVVFGQNYYWIFDIRIFFSNEAAFKVFTKKYQTTSQFSTVLGKSFEFFPQKTDLYIEKTLSQFLTEVSDNFFNLKVKKVFF